MNSVHELEKEVRLRPRSRHFILASTPISFTPIPLRETSATILRRHPQLKSIFGNQVLPPQSQHQTCSRLSEQEDEHIPTGGPLGHGVGVGVDGPEQVDASALQAILAFAAEKSMLGRNCSLETASQAKYLATNATALVSGQRKISMPLSTVHDDTEDTFVKREFWILVYSNSKDYGIRGLCQKLKNNAL